jgi:hypothetical protein
MGTGDRGKDLEMSETKHIGSFYERRGDDYLSVNATTDGDILEVEQFDAIRRRHMSVNFFAESAPKLIALISKAAGLPKEEPVEYEYALQMGSGLGEPYLLDKNFPQAGANGEYWGEKDERQRDLEWLVENFKSSKFWMVKRRKAGGIEDV